MTQQVGGKSVASATASVATGLFSQSAWKGLGSTLLRDGIPHGVWFVSYEYAKKQLNSFANETDEKTREIAVPMVSGAFAATSAWLVGYPFDLIKVI